MKKNINKKELEQLFSVETINEFEKLKICGGDSTSEGTNKDCTPQDNTCIKPFTVCTEVCLPKPLIACSVN